MTTDSKTDSGEGVFLLLDQMHGEREGNEFFLWSMSMTFVSSFLQVGNR